jgi:hypothetical protein
VEKISIHFWSQKNRSVCRTNCPANSSESATFVLQTWNNQGVSDR